MYSGVSKTRQIAAKSLSADQSLLRLNLRSTIKNTGRLIRNGKK